MCVCTRVTYSKQMAQEMLMKVLKYLYLGGDLERGIYFISNKHK
jgi:hypothetical protein